MPMNVFRFAPQLRVGAAGEEWFLRTFPEYDRNNAVDKVSVDMKHRETGALLELKTDTHEPRNLFVERYSNAETRKDGGVVRALNEGALFYAVYYVTRDEFHAYSTVALFRLLDKLVYSSAARHPQIREHGIVNCNYTSIGHTVPLSLVRSAEVSFEDVRLGKLPAALCFSVRPEFLYAPPPSADGAEEAPEGEGWL